MHSTATQNKVSAKQAPVKKHVSKHTLTPDPYMSKVIALINKSGYTLTYISEKSGVSRTTIEYWISGRTKRPQNISIDFVLKAIGYKRVLVREEEMGR